MVPIFLFWDFAFKVCSTAWITTAVRDDFPGFACWGDLILSKFQNQFCACSAQPGQKFELVSLFNTKIPAVLQVGDCILVTMIKFKSMLILLMTSML